MISTSVFYLIVYLWIAKRKHGVKSYYINEKHPLFELIVEYLHDESQSFTDYMKLVAEAIPVNLIVNDFSDPESVIETPLQNEFGLIISRGFIFSKFLERSHLSRNY